MIVEKLLVEGEWYAMWHEVQTLIEDVSKLECPNKLTSPEWGCCVVCKCKLSNNEET